MKTTGTVALALALGAWAGDAVAAVIWTCEVRHAYDLGASGTHERDATSTYAGKSFTANDETGEISGPNMGESRDWKPIPRRFAANQDAFQALRTSDGRPYMHLYIETFATGAAKPFLITEFGIGATRTGVCRVR